MAVTVNETTGTYVLSVDGATWLTGGRAPLNLTVLNHTTTTGTDGHGSFTTLTLDWGVSAGGTVALETDVKAYSDTELILFTQRWPNGMSHPPPPPPSPPPPTTPAELCSKVLNGTDQTGGAMLAKVPFTSDADCCAACIRNSSCDAWVVSAPPDPNRECYLIRGHRGTRPVADRNMGIVRGPGPSPVFSFLAPYPSFDFGAAEGNLGYLSWGGCQVSL